MFTSWCIVCFICFTSKSWISHTWRFCTFGYFWNYLFWSGFQLVILNMQELPYMHLFEWVNPAHSYFQFHFLSSYFILMFIQCSPCITPPPTWKFHGVIHLWIYHGFTSVLSQPPIWVCQYVPSIGSWYITYRLVVIIFFSSLK